MFNPPPDPHPFHGCGLTKCREDFYLGFGPLGSTRYGDLGLPTEQVGREVVDVLGSHGVGTEWDGDGNTRIKVLVSTVTDPWPAFDDEL